MTVVVYEVEADGKTRRFLSFLPQDRMKFGLPEQAIIGEVINDDLREATITLNPLFFEFLNEVMAEHGQLDEDLIAAAKELGTGAIHVIDQRAENHKGEPSKEDTFGAYEVKDGRIVRYHVNPYYAVKADDGFVRLPAVVFERWLLLIESLDPWDADQPK